ncbi:copper chaperone PCu(A)C [Corynebacterium jeddahense]|uniref:Copper chaperone PCu(A)C n=1 Tax=Corynebacterium jeddahense TaxID=1414719 RepID=A0ABY7UL52_9CORY|nr:copper chaperone PCu(A)C [Corynebacterium jeddahense]WCZ39043.1 hypothetical protein CJEDD_07215 [Corynebacterium jeddahense]
MHNRMTAAAVACLAALALAACSDTADEDAVATTPSMSAEKTQPATGNSPGEVGEGDVVLDEGTVRAKAASDAPDGSDMTAIFGNLRNTTDHDITVVGFTTSLSDATYQIHEVVDGKMQEKAGGFDIPAGGGHQLIPGGDHFMVLNYAPAIEAGDTVDLTLLLDGGSTVSIPDVAVRTMLPGDEDYGDQADHADHAAHAEHNH